MTSTLTIASVQKDAGAIADSLTGVDNAMKWPFVVNRSHIWVSPQRIQVRWAWRPCSGSCSHDGCYWEHLAQHASTTFMLWPLKALTHLLLPPRVYCCCSPVAGLLARCQCVCGKSYDRPSRHRLPCFYSVSPRKRWDGSQVATACLSYSPPELNSSELNPFCCKDHKN
jgi:hypothetical protein